MEKYVKGSQEWYDHTRKRLVEISGQLKDPSTNAKRREALYCEQNRLLIELEDYANENLVNNPIE